MDVARTLVSAVSTLVSRLLDAHLSPALGGPFNRATRHHSMVRPTLHAILLAFLLRTAAGAADDAPPGVCAGCHRQIVQTWRQTGMGRSLYKPAPSNTIEDYRNRHEFLHSLSDT